jgi:hypothetical protein
MNPNDYTNRFFNDYSPESNENKDLTIDLNMLALSLKAIRDNVTAAEFKDFLEILCEANLKEKLDQYLEHVKFIHSEGTDLATAFSHAQFDLLLDPGEDFIIN